MAHFLAPAHTAVGGWEQCRGGTVATDAATGPDNIVRGSLLELSRRLESEWRSAVERLLTSPARSVERERWAFATSRLTAALDGLERYSRTLDDGLGRRDWSARRPQLYGVPDQARDAEPTTSAVR